MNKNERRGVVIVVLAALIGGAGASGAAALPNPTWSTVCAGYSGRSWYAGGIGNASTTASDNDVVGAAVRYYAGSTPYVKSPHQATARRAAVPTGGYHQSYCGWTLTLPSSI